MGGLNAYSSNSVFAVAFLRAVTGVALRRHGTDITQTNLQLKISLCYNERNSVKSAMFGGRLPAVPNGRHL